MKNLLFGIALMMASTLWAQSPPKGEAVPDAAAAVKIAEAVLIPRYGKKQVTSERPYEATLKDDIWTVDGTLHCPNRKDGTPGVCYGGAAQVKISSKTGRVLSVAHYK